MVITCGHNNDIVEHCEKITHNGKQKQNVNLNLIAYIWT